jgi:hypothetical protein
VPDAQHQLFRHSRLLPVSIRVQLFAAAAMWLIGASILIVRGLGYLTSGTWHAWALAIGLALGVLKARLLLDRVAEKAIARILARGRASFFGFFSLRSWGFIALMMGGGMILRRIVAHPDNVGAGFMGAVYIGVGTALVLADRHFWMALLFPDAARPESASIPATSARSDSSRA